MCHLPHVKNRYKIPCKPTNSKIAINIYFFCIKYFFVFSSQQKIKTDQPIRPFACPVPGCTKRYKNVNGIKYHVKNGHTNGK